MTSLVDHHQVEKLLVLVAAIRSGLVDALAGDSPRNAEEVAADVEGDLRACRVMLEALMSLDVAEKVPGGYRLTALGRTHLLEPPPGAPLPAELERASLLHQERKFRGWLDLPYIIRHGRPPERDPGERDLRSFVRTMAEGDPPAMDEVVESCLAYAALGGGAVRRMIDVGGAVGHMARRFAERGVEATLLDRPEVLPEARIYLGDWAQRIRLVGGDFRESLPPGPFDLAYLGNIYHIYGPARNAALTARVHDALAPGGVIAIRDYVWERSARAPLFAVNMLQATEEGGVWREADYRGWLESAGFADIEVLDLTKSPNQLVLGRKKPVLAGKGA